MGKRDRNERRGVRRQFDEREARKQADRMENDGLDQGGDFNIWYVTIRSMSDVTSLGLNLNATSGCTVIPPMQC